jgi:magnesium-transporting ATPase (P-type)
MIPETSRLMYFNYEGAKPNLYKLDGFLSVLSAEGETTKISTNISNILLRGCILRNTDFVMGLVLYTGHDTKIMLNSGCPHMKQSKTDQYLNKFILILIMI